MFTTKGKKKTESRGTTLLFLHSYLSPYAYRCLFSCSLYLLECICVHIDVGLCCASIILLSYTDVIVELLINSSMNICDSVCLFALILFFLCERY